MPNRKLNVFLCHAKEDKPTVRDQYYPVGGYMSKQLLSHLFALAFVGVLLAACGPGRFLGPTLTPTLTITPSPTATYTPSPTNTSTPTLTPTPTPTLGVGSAWTSPKDGMVMMFVPAGKFSMGSDSGSDDEKPVHDVTLDSFWIDKTEVTNAMYARCVEAGQCDAPSSNKSYTRDSHYGNSQYADYPVLYVSWNDANAYCGWRGDGTRLPTEAEWEKSASWDDGKKEKHVYPWGNSFDGSLLNFCDKNCTFFWADKSVDDGYEFTAPVGHYSGGVSYYGLLDMAGNVQEWVSSLYQNYPYSSSDGREDLSASGSRVLRGGSWGNYDNNVRSSYRSRAPDLWYDSVGFRCSRSP